MISTVQAIGGATNKTGIARVAHRDKRKNMNGKHGGATSAGGRV